ncbi:hypothetical protein LCGC14_1809810 [marine sediment metagenome]|uniref:Uncharacterized protein n=1 Tax=marine sediment metagenome TaxID=412755 RepID=A0A0F9JLT2_9ZZZZ
MIQPSDQKTLDRMLSMDDSYVKGSVKIESVILKKIISDERKIDFSWTIEDHRKMVKRFTDFTLEKEPA